MDQVTPEKELINTVIGKIKENLSQINGTYLTSSAEYKKISDKIMSYRDTKIRHGIIKTLALRSRDWYWEDAIFTNSIHLFLSIVYDKNSGHEAASRAAAAMGYSAGRLTKPRYYYDEEELNNIKIDEDMYYDIILAIADRLLRCRQDKYSSINSRILMAESLIALKAVPTLEKFINARKIDETIIDIIIESLAYNAHHDNEMVSGWRMFDIDNPLLDDGLKKYTNNIIKHLNTLDAAPSKLIKDLEKARRQSIHEIIQHIEYGYHAKYGPLNENNIEEYFILDENGKFLECNGKYLNYNLLDLAAMYGDNQAFSILANRCDKNLLTQKNAHGLTPQHYMHIFNTCDNLKDYCPKKPYSFSKATLWHSLMCSLHKLPAFITKIPETVVKMLEGSKYLDGIASVVHNASLWTADVCNSYSEYKAIKSSIIGAFNHPEEKMYLLKHHKIYAHVNLKHVFCYPHDKQLSSAISFPIYNEELSSDLNENLYIKLCEYGVVKNSYEHDSEL